MSQPTTGRRAWLFAPFPVRKSSPLMPTHERWRAVAKLMNISAAGRLRLEWIIYRHQGHTPTETCRHFGIARKSFYKWFKLFDCDNLETLHLLQDRSRAPARVRQGMIKGVQEARIVELRTKYLRYGKMKLAKIYQRTYGETISSWQIQKVIERTQLYYHPVKNARTQRKRARAHEKKRITELKLYALHPSQKASGYIICLDTIELRLARTIRFIFTAIDKYGKVAYARMYPTKSSKNGEDFLRRLHYLLDGAVPRVGHDNGSEFEKYFAAACRELNIEQYHSRPRTPKDNPNNERFNRTLQEEFIALKGYTPDCAIFNQQLTEWLIEYNFNRPHEALRYETPIQFSKGLPMYASCTKS